MHDYLCFHISGGKWLHSVGPGWSDELVGDHVSTPTYCQEGSGSRGLGGREMRNGEEAETDDAKIQIQLLHRVRKHRGEIETHKQHDHMQKILRQ